MKSFGHTFPYRRRIYHIFLKRSLTNSIFFLFSFRLAVFLAFLSTINLWPPSIVLAQKPFFRETISLGKPAKPFLLSVHEQNGSIRLVVGQTSEIIPISEAEEVSVEMAEVAVVGHVAVVHVRGKKGEAAALVAAKRGNIAKILWSAQLDAKGDPGERYANAIEISERKSDGLSEVVIGQYREGARICGQARTILFPRAIDPESFALKPVLLDRFQDISDDPEIPVQTITATRKSPGPQGPPLAKLLRFTDSSSVLGIQDATSATPPNGLTDGNLKTSWTEGRGSGGRGEFTVARWDASKWPIRALAFVFASSDKETAQQSARPKSFWIVGDNQQRFLVNIPEDPAAYSGERYWVVPPKPLKWRCLSIVFHESYLPVHELAAHASMAEVEAYTEMDFKGGLSILIQALIEDREDAAEAADLLAIVGPESVVPLVDAWKRMSRKGRRRAVRVFASSAGRENRAVDALVMAVRDEDSKVREDALKALIRIGPVAFIKLSSLISQPSELADRAALAIAKSDPVEAIPLLLNVIKRKDGSRRPRIRRALMLSVAKGGERAVEKLSEWLKQDPPLESLTSVVLALSGVENARPLAGDLLRALIGKAQSFEDLWRLVQASKSLPLDAEVEAWLGDITLSEERWMLRKAALEALDEGGTTNSCRYATKTLKDTYPRVRVAGLSILSRRCKRFDLVSERAQKDLWPMVRAAAVSELVSDPNAGKTIVRAIDDPAKIVRAAAIKTLLARKERRAWRVIEKRLLDDNEWPRVLAEAIAFAKELCIVESVDSLKRVFDRGLQPQSWLPDAELAASALDAIMFLKGKDGSKSFLESASVSFAPPSLQAVVKQANRYSKPCKPE
ncbi:MAG: hypothetical protein JXA30_11025 [Deltaproteobacteria bacterium]|nr:hypothetical protein [Deltaproteobacteria bacterium]